MTDYAVRSATDDERRRRGLLWLWLAVVAVLLAGLVVAMERLAGCSGTGCPSFGSGSGATLPGDYHSTNPDGATSSNVSIRVSGREQGGLAPGVTSPVVVSVANVGAKPARITAAQIVVGDASASCRAADSIRVTHYDASTSGARRYDVAPGARIKIPLTISMLDLASNQNACKNARFPLTFQATAQQG